jgi:hypothetical protein
MGFWLSGYRRKAEDQPHDRRKLEDCAVDFFAGDSALLRSPEPSKDWFIP